MRTTELITLLEEHLDAYGDREVLVAQQPSWPLAANVLGVYDRADAGEPDDDEPDEEPDDDVLWIVTSEVTSSDARSPYAPAVAWDLVEGC